MVNRIILIGRLVRDPELRTTNTGKDVVEFTIAVQKRIKPNDPNEKDADFFRIKAWGQTANYVNDYLTKGRLVSVEGRMESRKYTDKEQREREIWEVIADNVNGLDRPRDDAPAPTQAPASSNSSRGSANAQDEYDPFADE